MSKATRATMMLERAGIPFTLYTYKYEGGTQIGLQAAAALGERPERVLKTLMALVDRKPVCVIVPSDKEVSMKKLAVAFGGRSAEMMTSMQADWKAAQMSAICWSESFGVGSDLTSSPRRGTPRTR